MHSLTKAEIYKLIASEKALAGHKFRREPLTREESDRAMRIARVLALAVQVFGDHSTAGGWLRAPDAELEDRNALELFRTEAGGMSVESMLLQIDEGMAA